MCADGVGDGVGVKFCTQWSLVRNSKYPLQYGSRVASRFGRIAIPLFYELFFRDAGELDLSHGLPLLQLSFIDTWGTS